MNEPGGLSDSKAKLRGRLLVLLAGVMWSTSSLFAKSDVFADWPDEQRGLILAFWRALFAGLVLCPLVRRPQWSWKLVPMLIAFPTMNYTFLSSMVQTTAANTIWLQHTAPVWVFLAGAFVFREQIKRSDWLLLLFATSGIGIILMFEFVVSPDGNVRSARGVQLGLMSGFTYAMIVLSLRHLRAIDSAWIVALNFGVTCVVFAPFVLRTEHFPHGIQWAYLAGFGMLQMGLPYVIFARGVRTITAHEASGIVLIEPVLVPVWALVHGEVPSWWTMVGASLILIGLSVRFLTNRKEIKNENAASKSDAT